MYAGRRLLCLCLVALVLVLSACGTAATASIVRKPASTIQKPMPTIEVTQTASPLTPTPAVSIPARLLVPAIGVNALVENLGLLPDGNMATPTQSPWDDVGWYNRGPRPGEKGSAVIDGHLDRPGGDPAVFWSLRNLHPGDMVMVVDTRGETLRFQVTRVAAYPPNEAPLQEIFENTGGKYLNLITCAGDWIPSEHQTALRLVVYTTLLQS